MNSNGRQWPPVSEARLREALAKFPSWLAERYATWIRDQEARGHEFTTAEAAVIHAVAAGGAS